MLSPRLQRTIARPVSVEGYGYWSGQDVTVQFHPASAHTGIVFLREDLGPQRVLPVHVHRRIDLERRTSLAVGEARVDMIEHVMAALAGLRIDNCTVIVNGAEMPGCDGSARLFIEALDSAGIMTHDAPVHPLLITESIRCGGSEKWIEAHPARRNSLTVEFHLNYPGHRAIGAQSLALEITPETVRRDLGPARTFVLAEEAAAMVAQGKGTRVTTEDLLIFGPDGPIDNKLRFENECVRHKILDVVGDLALAGRPIYGHIVAFRSGHQLNAQLVETLLAAEAVQQAQRKSA